MSEETSIEYDYESSISFLGNLQTICSLFGGFAFTGITLIITLGEPAIPLVQAILFILYMSMGMFTGAVSEVNNMSNLVSLDSRKQIIPIYPARWRTVNILITVGNFAIHFSITLRFLLKNLPILFVVSLGMTVFWFIWGYLRGWKPLKRSFAEREFYFNLRGIHAAFFQCS